MPNPLESSLGETGKMLEKSSQDFVAKKLYIKDGACLSICAKFMTDIVQLKIPTKNDYIEVAQWVQAGKNWQSQIDLLAAASGLRKINTYDGQLLTDEIYLNQFLNRVSGRPSFNLFGFWNNTRTSGHALLFYTWSDESWIMLDPNFGMAVWPHLNGLIVGLKRLLDAAYSDFGPKRRFHVMKYEK